METAAALKPKGSKNKTKATPSQEASPETSPATTAAVTTKKEGSPVKSTKPTIGALPPAPAPAVPAPTTTTAPTTAAGAAPSLLSWSRWAPYFNLPVTGSFASEAQKAAYIVDNMGASVEKNVLRELLKQADGAAFLTVAKAGVFVTGQVGSGLVLLKDAKTGKWSAPAAVATVGGGVGPQGGWDVTDVVLLFKTETATEAFKGSYQVAAGVSGGVALGPFGRQGNAHVHLRLGSKKLAVAYAFSWSKGFFLGAALDAKLVKALEGRNASVYGPAHAALEDILGGKVAPPAEAKPLYAALDRFLAGP